MATPNIAGFKDAMSRLRQATGSPCTFHVPQTPVWPTGTKVDPHTGRPYDPTIKADSGSGYDDVVKTCGVIFKDASRLRPGADTRFEAGGEFSGMDAILDLDVSDYPDVEGAVRVSVFGMELKIEEWKPGGLVTQDRWLVYCQEI